MTIDIALPTIVYEDDRNPDHVHEVLAKAQRQGPIALGPYGLELLSYELVRTVLRDSRFVIPRGIGLVVQGITSGPVWDRVTKQLISLDGAEHQRLRHLVAKAFTPGVNRGRGWEGNDDGVRQVCRTGRRLGSGHVRCRSASQCW